ncbi:unnamed protein product [Mytilus edulis]|uniref:C1q domain-containing protein n=1 Tax=Mytilus edulis TaxID=6550 RepID=A0A8S3TJJ0_MYTED|nr:unnamed protein product [Mytilus edulis]
MRHRKKPDIFEIKFSEMEQNYTLLKQAHEVLQQKFSLQESEIITLRKTSVELEKKISVIEQLKTINQSMDLHQIQNKMQQLQQITSLLKRNQNARNQDFLALYNLTLMSEKKLQEQFENNQNLTNKKVFSIITNNYKLMENQLDMLTHELNASLTNVFSKMNMMSSQIGENSKKVALTACTVADKNIKGAITFPNIYTSVGITNQTAFQTTGKFVCDVPGLYYISSYIRTSENGFEYYLMKNNVLISKSATTTWPGSTSYSTSVITAAVDVQTNDELYIRTPNSYRIQYGFSCLTVIKVK